MLLMHSMILQNIFFCLRSNFNLVFGVVVFVYVAAVEQLMLYDTIIDYVINSVVVLLVAEVDELMYYSIARMEIHPQNHGKGHLDTDHSYKIISTAIEHDEEHAGENRNSNNPVSQGLNGEEVLSSSLSLSSGHRDKGLVVSSVLISQDYEPVRESYIQHLNTAASFEDMVKISLTKHERDVFLIYDYFIARANFCCCFIPMTFSKITVSLYVHSVRLSVNSLSTF